MENISLRPLLTLITLIALFISATGCSPYVSRIPIDLNQQKSIHKTHEILTSAQQQIEPDFPNYASQIYPSTGYRGVDIGVGAAMNAYFTHLAAVQAINSIRPIQNALAGYNYNTAVNQRLTQSLRSIPWLHLNKTQFSGVLTDNQKKSMVEQLERVNDAMMFVNLYYKLSPLMDTMEIMVDVEIYTKVAPRPLKIYNNSFFYLERIEHSTGLPKANAIAWSSNGAARTKNAMNTAIPLLTQVIMADIQDPGIQPNNELPTNIRCIYGQGFAGRLSGYLEKKIGDHYVIRAQSGKVLIVNDVMVVKKRARVKK